MKHYTVDVKVLRALTRFASKEETRFYLNGVFVEIKGGNLVYVATDGHRIGAYRSVAPEGDELAIIIPTNICRHFYPGKDKSTDAILTVDGSDATLKYGNVAVSFKPIDGVYPDWRRCVPKSASGKVAQFNHNYMQDFDAFGNDIGASLAFFHHSGLDPSPVTYGERTDVFGVLMPMRRDSPAWEVFAWAKGANIESAPVKSAPPRRKSAKKKAAPRKAAKPIRKTQQKRRRAA